MRNLFSELYVMIINISDLIRKSITKKEINVVLDLKSFNDGYETVNVVEPIKVQLVIGKIEDVLSLDGVIVGKLELLCSRCLQKFDYDLNIEFHEKLTNNPDNRDDELIFINNDDFDLAEIVENNIIISLPIQRLCKNDCKGLCHACGKNLNCGSCNCDNSNYDPRLEKLKDLFSNN
jgi:uncharacterized protein